MKEAFDSLHEEEKNQLYEHLTINKALSSIQAHAEGFFKGKKVFFCICVDEIMKTNIFDDVKVFSSDCLGFISKNDNGKEIYYSQDDEVPDGANVFKPDLWINMNTGDLSKYKMDDKMDEVDGWEKLKKPTDDDVRKGNVVTVELNDGRRITPKLYATHNKWYTFDPHKIVTPYNILSELINFTWGRENFFLFVTSLNPELVLSGRTNSGNAASCAPLPQATASNVVELTKSAIERYVAAGTKHAMCCTSSVQLNNFIIVVTSPEFKFALLDCSGHFRSLELLFYFIYSNCKVADFKSIEGVISEACTETAFYSGTGYSFDYDLTCKTLGQVPMSVKEVYPQMLSGKLYNSMEDSNITKIVPVIPFILLKEWSKIYESDDTENKRVKLAHVLNAIRLLELNFNWRAYELYPLFWEMIKSMAFAGTKLRLETYFNNAEIASTNSDIKITPKTDNLPNLFVQKTETVTRDSLPPVVAMINEKLTKELMKADFANAKNSSYIHFADGTPGFDLFRYWTVDFGDGATITNCPVFIELKSSKPHSTTSFSIPEFVDKIENFLFGIFKIFTKSKTK